MDDMQLRHNFRKNLLSWYLPDRRPMPWKGEKDAYKIWVSEVILQQTQVKQGTAYYLKFVERFPSVMSLAEADQQTVLKYWQGLGYYRRAINLHKGAQEVVDRHGGAMPNTYGELLALTGIGHYTAAAIASFAFGLNHAVLDGNVYRILSRYFGIYEPIDTTSGKKTFQALADNLIDPECPPEYNQAIMDFGALICTPNKPLCVDCPLSAECFALQHQAITQLPVKSKQMVKKERPLTYIILRCSALVLMRERRGNDIFKHMYEFVPYPLPDEIKALDASLGIMSENDLTFSPIKKYILTHRHLLVQSAEFIVERPFEIDGYQWYSLQEAQSLPVPAFIADMLETLEHPA